MTKALIPWYVKFFLALLFGALSIAAIGVDLFNAYLYGLTTSPTMAVLAIIVAVAVVLLPFGLELGLPRILWLLWLFCVVATMYCAFQYYYVSAQRNNVAAASAHDVYTTAGEEKKLALATLTRIKDAGDVEELGKLAVKADASLDNASASVAKYCKGRRVSDDCRLAQSTKTAADAASTLAHQKLNDAKAWAEAKTTLAKAAATQTKGDAVEHDVDLPALIGALILVQFLAGLSGVATRLGAEALQERAAGRAAKAKAQSKKAPAAPVQPTNGGNVVSITAAQWLKDRTIRQSGKLPGGQAKKNFERYTGTKITAAEFKAALISLLGAEIIEDKNSGYVIHGYGLAPLTEVKTEKQAAII